MPPQLIPIRVLLQNAVKQLRKQMGCPLWVDLTVWEHFDKDYISVGEVNISGQLLHHTMKQGQAAMYKLVEDVIRQNIQIQPKPVLKGINEFVKSHYVQAVAEQFNTELTFEKLLDVKKQLGLGWTDEDFTSHSTSYRVWGGPLTGKWVAQQEGKQWFEVPYYEELGLAKMTQENVEWPMETTFKSHRYDLRYWAVELPTEVRWITNMKYGTKDLEVDWEYFDGRVWVSEADYEQLSLGLRVLRMLLCLMKRIPLV